MEIILFESKRKVENILLKACIVENFLLTLIRQTTLTIKLTKVMSTLEKIKLHAAEIMASGGPKNTWERNVVIMATPKKQAGNAGKRTKKNHNNNW